MAQNIDTYSQLELFLNGQSTHAYKFLGSHFMTFAGRSGVVFRVWAPNAKSVAVVGDFNGWDENANYMYRMLGTGVWECFIDGIGEYENYKYSVENQWGGRQRKADPYRSLSFLQEGCNGTPGRLFHERRHGRRGEYGKLPASDALRGTAVRNRKFPSSTNTSL